jgi:hypothetical protein
MKATHGRSITKNRNGVIIFRGEWEPNTPDAVRHLKLLHAAMAPDAKNGQTCHLAYSHPVSEKQRKALEHGYRLRTMYGAVVSIKAMMTQYGKELRKDFPATCDELEYAISLLEKISQTLRERGPL